MLVIVNRKNEELLFLANATVTPFAIKSCTDRLSTCSKKWLEIYGLIWHNLNRSSERERVFHEYQPEVQYAVRALLELAKGQGLLQADKPEGLPGRGQAEEVGSHRAQVADWAASVSRRIWPSTGLLARVLPAIVHH